jgi:hypothetical protein
MIARRRIKTVSIAFICCLLAYAIYSWLAFIPPEIITEHEASQIAMEKYVDAFESKYNFTDPHIVRIELRDERRIPWAPHPKWYVRVGSNATIVGEPYHLCLDVEIDAVSGKVLRSVALP